MDEAYPVVARIECSPVILDVKFELMLILYLSSLLSYLNYASLYIAGKFYRGPGRNVVLGACLGDLHWYVQSLDFGISSS